VNGGEKSYVLLAEHTPKGLMPMPEGPNLQISNQLKAEIQTLETHYQTIKDYLSGKEYEKYAILGTLRAYKDSLSRISMHILALYQLKGQKAKITWESLLENINSALTTLQSNTNRNPRAAIQTALNMSEPKIEEVMTYMSSLKQSLQ
jgi:hypothetical protein